MFVEFIKCDYSIFVSDIISLNYKSLNLIDLSIRNVPNRSGGMVTALIKAYSEESLSTKINPIFSLWNAI